MDDTHHPIASSSSTTSPNHILSILLSLPISESSHLDLLKFHRPFSHPSHLNAGSATKWLNRLNQAIISRDDLQGKKFACEIAAEVVCQDEEGWVLNGWGKGWMGACLGAICTQNVILSTVTPPIALLEAIILEAKGYPGFERDAVQPIMGKLSLTLCKLMERCLAGEDRPYDVLLPLLNSIQTLLVHAPVPWRPSTPSLRSQLINLVTFAVSPPSTTPVPCPSEVRRAAVELLANTHLTSGKANSSTVWSTNLKDALGGLGASISAITADGIQEEPPRIAIPTSTSLPPIPTVPGMRLPIALEYMEGYTEIILSMLRTPSSRPVNVPIAALVSVALRCLNLTVGTPTLDYISPTQHAGLLAALPRIWGCGLLILAEMASAVGDHLFPHLSEILDHTLFLAETTPLGMVESHLQFLRFWQFWLEVYPSSILPIEYTTRLVKLCLDRLGPLLDKRPVSSSMEQGSGGGKRGKKRARGMEDGLVGGLEGRSGQTLGKEADITLEALRLIPLLHPAPLLPPALLTFSIRLHLSIYISLDRLSTRFEDLEKYEQISKAVKHVLEDAVLLPEEEGTQRGWKSVIIGLVNDPPSSWNLLLHRSLPPLHRPAPHLASLHIFAPESEEEKKLRTDMGFSTVDDLAAAKEADGDIDIDDVEMATSFSGLANRRASVPHAEDLHVTHDPRQVVPTAQITPPVVEKDEAAAAAPIIIDSVPMDLSSTKASGQAPLPPVGLPAGLASGSSNLIVHPPVPAMPSEMSVPVVPTRPEPTPATQSTKSTQLLAAPADGEDDDDDELPPLDSGSSDEGGSDEGEGDDDE